MYLSGRNDPHTQVTVVRWKDTHHYPAARLPGITEFVLAINNTDGSVPHVTVEEQGR